MVSVFFSLNFIHKYFDIVYYMLCLASVLFKFCLQFNIIFLHRVPAVESNCISWLFTIRFSAAGGI